MEHRQRPQIDRVLAEAGGQDIRDGVEIGAAVMRHHALRIARGARRVAQRNGVPLVERVGAGKEGIAGRHGGLIFDLSDPGRRAERRVIDVDHDRLRPRHQFQRIGNDGGELRIDQQDLRTAMVELERDRGGVEPDVQRVEHGAGHRHREMRLVHRRQVRQHGGDRVAATDAAGGEVRGKPPAALIGLPPGEAAALIDRAGVVRIDRGAAGQETQRRQRNEVGLVLVKADTVGTLRLNHNKFLLLQCVMQTSS